MIAKNTATISFYNIKRVVFVMETQIVIREVETECVYILTYLLTYLLHGA